MSDKPPPLPPRPGHLLPPTLLTDPKTASTLTAPEIPPRYYYVDDQQTHSQPSTGASPTNAELLQLIEWPCPTDSAVESSALPTNESDASTSTSTPPARPIPKRRTTLMDKSLKPEENIYQPLPEPREPRPNTVSELPVAQPDIVCWDPDTCSDNESTTSDPCSWLQEEPLYQFTSCYEAVPEKLSYTNIEVEDETYSDFLDPDSSVQQPRRRSAHKTPWCGVSRVIDTRIIGKMSKQEIAVQEAKFEILTTETSFLKTLATMKKHFILSRELMNETILLREDHRQLFSMFKPIQKCSKAFLRDLDRCWKRSIFMPGIFEVISRHAKDNFSCYVKYCAQLEDIRDKLKTLLSTNKKFKKALTDLESSECCAKLPLYSFLSIPMKRIVNLNLLLKTARAKLLHNYECDKTLDFEMELGNCLTALDLMQQVCKRSDKESQTTNRIKKLFDFHSKLKFPSHILQVSIISPHRWLVMHGDVRVHGISEMENSRTSFVLKKTKSMIKISNKSLRLFLLNDMLMLTKPTADSFKVKDYCTLENVQVSTPNDLKSLNPDLVLDTKREYKILLIMQANHENKRIEMVLSCAVERERDVWMNTLKQHKVQDSAGKITPQRMVCIYPFHTFAAGQIDLKRGDEVVVDRTLDNGWFSGVRKRGNKPGSFPPSRVEDASTVFPLVELFN